MGFGGPCQIREMPYVNSGNSQLLGAMLEERL